MSLAKLISIAFSGSAGAFVGFASATLTRKTPGTRTVGAEIDGTNPTSTTYACKAMVEPGGKFRDGTLVREGASMMLVLGGSLAFVPKTGDTIVFRSVTYKVLRVKSSPDPGGAEHECEVAH